MRGQPLKGRLVLEDGAVFEGRSFGAAVPAAGEVVFTTGMVGYPEALTDPSYRGQILSFTYPSLGNYGVPEYPRAAPGAAAGDGEETHATLPPRPWESDGIHASGVLCASYSEEFSHHAARHSLGDWLRDQGIAGLTGIDTRALTKRIRTRGSLLGRIEIDGHPVPGLVDPNKRNLVAEVSTRRVRRYGRGTPLVLLDCGGKNNQVRMLVDRGAEVRVVPWDHPLPTRPRDYAGVILSNGPGDPRLAAAAVHTVRRLVRQRVPTLGICLGHQVLALAAGAKTYKMKFGHRAHNQPCLDTRTGRCYQTSQNHGFAVDGETLPRGFKSWFVNANDGTNEGLRHERYPLRSVQFHPEAAPGPGGTEWILDEFLAEARR
ncbi:MAG TPA: glutamine-hydrolyzing carbamoyl-phosphate synthase small subunit [Candidatus Polarisedimenticolia bacterium]|nr:glutamine-hydrolyzing carbamoyl-phosphate synthase small subunit [Candidatus Polarisedimenticolia bacterium]